MICPNCKRDIQRRNQHHEDCDDYFPSLEQTQQVERQINALRRERYSNTPRTIPEEA